MPEEAVNPALLPDDETHPHYVDPAKLAPPPVVRGKVPDDHPHNTRQPLYAPETDGLDGYTVEQPVIH